MAATATANAAVVPETPAAPAPITARWTHSVRGKLYDLSSFNHPGGPIALGLGRGRDCDDLIRSYHPFSEEKVRAILAKYEVKGVESPIPAADVFQNVDSEFARELKAEVRQVLQNQRVATTWRYVEYALMLAAALTAIYYYVNGSWLAMLLTPFLVWVFGVNTFHDASHFAVSRNWAVNSLFTYLFPWFSSPFTWYYQHVVGHHPYVNIRGRDPDLNHHSALHRYAPWHRFKRLHAYQEYTYWVIIALGSSIQALVMDLASIRKAMYQHVVPMPRMIGARFYRHFAGRAMVFLLCFVWPFMLFPFGKAYVFAFLPSVIFSALYITISQVGHITNETITAPNRDFYAHQIEHTHNFGTDSALCFYLSGGLNLQVEHHLFPGVNHCHLRHIVPLVKRLCKKYNITYHESEGYFDAVSKHLSVIKTLSVR